MNIEELRNVTNLEEWQNENGKKRSVFLLVAEEVDKDKVATCGFIAGTTVNLVDMLAHHMKENKTVDKIVTKAMLHSTVESIIADFEKRHESEENQPKDGEEK